MNSNKMVLLVCLGISSLSIRAMHDVDEKSEEYHGKTSSLLKKDC
jgi:hypothetical protein